MKPSLFLLVPVFMLSACDKKEQYSNSNLLALSALYDFEAVKGRVKQLEQTLYSASDEKVHQVVAHFGPDGCVSEFTLDSKMYGKAQFKKENDRLAGSEQGNEAIFTLGERCQISGKSFTRQSDKYTYQYDASGRIKELFYSVTKLKRFYSWNENGLPSGTKSYIADQLIDEVILSYPDPLNKPADYRSETKSVLGNSIVDMRCQYHGVVPYSCDVVKQATESEAEEKYHATIEVVFYPE